MVPGETYTTLLSCKGGTSGRASILKESSASVQIVKYDIEAEDVIITP